jgi:hypothetical protein
LEAFSLVAMSIKILLFTIILLSMVIALNFETVKIFYQQRQKK